MNDHAKSLAGVQERAGIKSAIRHQLFIDGKFVDAQTAKHSPASIRTTTRRSPRSRWPARRTSMRRWQRRRPRFRHGAHASAGDRGRILLRLADLIEANGEELARLESLDTGHPLRDSRALDVPRTALCFRYFGGMADKFEGSIPVDAGFLNYTCANPWAWSARSCRGIFR
jgi:acyl-CoA reductase-like NAD-dependent aldehyde dehydrogenase